MKRLVRTIGVPLLATALGVGAPAAASAHGWRGGYGGAVHGGWRGGHGGGWHGGAYARPGWVAPAYPYYRAYRGYGYHPAYRHYGGYSHFGYGPYIYPGAAGLSFGITTPFLGLYWGPGGSTWDGTGWGWDGNDGWGAPY